MRRSSGWTRFLFPVALAAGLTAAFAAWIGSGLGGETVVLWFDDLATVAAALLATVFCGLAAAKQAGRLRLFWLLLAAACGAWTLGEALWAVYDLAGEGAPMPSWADVAYLAALPPTAAALLVHPAVHGRAVGRTRSLVDGLVLAAAVFFVAWIAILEPLGRSTDFASLGDLVTIAYPLSDVVIVFLVVLVIRGTSSTDRLDLWCLLAGLLLITFSDALYSYLTEVEDYASGSIIDTGWFAGYLAITLGAYTTGAHVAVERRRASEPQLSAAAMVTPLLAVLAALSLLTTKLQLGHSLDRATLTIAFVLVGLVLVRQALLVLDALSPRRASDVHIADRFIAALGEAAPEPIEPAPTSEALR
jgi:diguanylate cyclase